MMAVFIVKLSGRSKEWATNRHFSDRHLSVSGPVSALSKSVSSNFGTFGAFDVNNSLRFVSHGPDSLVGMARTKEVSAYEHR